MKTHRQGAKNGPSWFAGMIAGLVAIGTVVAAPPANEAVAVPRTDSLINENTGQKKIQASQNNSPGTAHAVSANQQNGQFIVATTTFNGDANLNTIAKLANNNGVTDVVAVSNDKAEFNSGSDTAYVAPSAATMNTVPLDTSPNSAVVGRNTAENGKQVNSEGGAGFGARLVVDFAAGSSVWTDLGVQATACNA